MAIQIEVAPARLEGLVSDSVRGLMQMDEELSKAGRAGNDTQIAMPHQVFTLGLDVITGSAEDLNKATATGWRYMVMRGITAIAAAEVTGDKPASMRFSSLNTGPFVESTVVGVNSAEQLDFTKKNDCVMRLLKIPGVYFVGLWLHGDDDKIVPLAPAPHGLEANRAYEPAEIFSVLLPVAREKLQFDSRPRRKAELVAG